jgi:hypothetical protein
MWPFDIFAKRREREYREQLASAERVRLLKQQIEAENRRQMAAATAINRASLYRSSASASAQRQAGLRAVAGGPSSSARSSSNTSTDIYADPLNPLSPLNPFNQSSMWSAPAEEPRHSSSHCDSSSSHSHSSSDHSSSHSHSSHDHSCSSSSYDSGSSSSGSDW